MKAHLKPWANSRLTIVFLLTLVFSFFFFRFVKESNRKWQLVLFLLQARDRHRLAPPLRVGEEVSPAPLDPCLAHLYSEVAEILDHPKIYPRVAPCHFRLHRNALCRRVDILYRLEDRRDTQKFRVHRHRRRRENYRRALKASKRRKRRKVGDRNNAIVAVAV